ncbi:MAG: hypothetical protein JEY99_07850 [Spirochaetales bacterium]|nr:hypothetical protein [Spirochaetales bacterium]
MKQHVVLIVLILLLASCRETSPPVENDTEIPGAFLGSWINTDNGGYLLVTTRGISGEIESVNNDGLSIISASTIELGEVALNLQGGTILKYSDHEEEILYFKVPDQLHPASGSISFVSDALEALKSTHRDLSSIIGTLGSIDVIISNQFDPEEIQNQTGLYDGEEFSFNDLLAGGTYEIVAKATESGEELTSIKYSPNPDSEDIGSLPVNDSDYNMKIQLLPVERFLVGDGYVYNIGFAVTNFGTAVSPPSIVDVFSTTLSLGTNSYNLPTLNPQGTQEFQIQIALNSMLAFEETHQVAVSVTDGNGSVWEDRFSLVFYRDYFHFYFDKSRVSTESEDGGFLIISPDGDCYPINKGIWNTWLGSNTPGIPREGRIPRWDSPFTVLFSGATTAEQEYIAEFSVGTDPMLIIDQNSAVNPIENEPNDSIIDAVSLRENTAIRTYIGVGEMDMVTVYPSSIATVSNISATNGAYSDRIEVSWDAVINAEGYNIYRQTQSIDTGIVIEYTIENRFTDLSVQSGYTYLYWIQAWSADEGYSSFTYDEKVPGSVN